MQQLEQFSQWYNGLPQREKILVVATSAVLVITMLYLMIWEPIYQGLDQQQQKYKIQKGTVSWMQNAASEVKTLKRSGATSVTNSDQPVSLVIEQSASKSGLKKNISKLESSGKDGAQVKLDSASFDQMLIWLNTLETRHGVIATSAKIERSDKIGIVNARLSFSKS